jgi:adenylate cyclase class 2
LEIERKIPVSELFLENNIVKYLTDMIGAPNDEITQIDVYFSNPMKDFHTTDEALRIRRIKRDNNEEKSELTYKGPKIGTDMKLREEITVELTDFREMSSILEKLGFISVFVVSKNRTNWYHRSTIISFDIVKDLGRFIEIEFKSDGDFSGIQSGKAQIETVLSDLFPNWSGIEERKSYLELLLETRGHHEK